MSKPTQGKIYITIQGDTTAKIATGAYGTPDEYSLIIDTNQTQQKLSRDGDIAVGTELYIPVDTELANLRAEQLNRGLT